MKKTKLQRKAIKALLAKAKCADPLHTGCKEECLAALACPIQTALKRKNTLQKP
jgi:hypothetical protein